MATDKGKVVSDFLLGTIEKLPLPQEAHKIRSFSTSTPFIPVQDKEQKLRSLSLSIFSATTNDSGLGSSLADSDISVTSPLDGAVPTITVSVCRTPTTNCSFPLLTGRNCQLSATPISVRKNNHCRRSLDSVLELSDHSDSFNTSVDETLNSSHDSSRLSRTFDRSFPRRLDLDLDIYDEHEDSSFRLSTTHVSLKSVTSMPNVNESHFYNLNDILEKFSPSEPDRLIGRRMGRETIDILSHLNILNVSCVATILSYMNPDDLCRMRLVSCDWKVVVESDTRANQRRKQFMKRNRTRAKEQGKENFGYKRSARQQRDIAGAPLQDRPVTQPTTQQASVQHRDKTVTDQFIEVACTLKNEERLQKCPQCRKPAKVYPVQDRGVCQNPDCKYDFCTKCSYEFHHSKDCVPIVSKKTKTDTIGAKKSKKNLKRL